MPTTKANTGYQATFAVQTGSPLQFLEVSEIKTIKFPALSANAIDVTHLQSPNRHKEYIKGLKDYADLEIGGNYIGDKSQALLWSLAETDEPDGDFRFLLTFPSQGNTDVEQYEAEGFIVEFGPATIEADKAVEFTMKLKVKTLLERTTSTSSATAAGLFSRAGFGRILSIAQNQPPVGWTGTTFDDSAWLPPVEDLLLASGFYTADDKVPMLNPLAQYVTFDTSVQPTGTHALYRVQFNMLQVQDITLQIMVDRQLVEVWINGVQVFEDTTMRGDGDVYQFTSVLLPAANLVQGENTLAIRFRATGWAGGSDMALAFSAT